MFLVSEKKKKKNGTGEYIFDSLGISIDIVKPGGKKCARCWAYSESVGCDPDHQTVCSRCAEVVKDI